MLIVKETVLEDHPQLVHLTEDNMNSLKAEITEVRDALRAKFPDEPFPRIMPHLDPDGILPKESLFELEIGPDPEDNLYGSFGWTIRSDRLPYCVFLTKFIGIQMDVETPFIEELLMWVHHLNHDDEGEEQLPCRNSQWRHEYFQKRRQMLKKQLKQMLQKEIMDLIMVTQHFKDGTLIQETGFFSFYAAIFQRKMLNDVGDTN